MKKVHSIIITIFIVVIQTACSANTSAESIEETIMQSSSSSIASQEIPSSQSSSSISESSVVTEEPRENNAPPWNPDSPFGTAIENASVQLYEIFQDNYSMLYSVGFADYNLDGVPELFVGLMGGLYGGRCCVFDVTGQEYQFLCSYSVGNLGQRFAIMENPYSGARYLKSESEAVGIFDAFFDKYFFEPNESNINVWGLHNHIQTESRASEVIEETDEPSETYSYNHDYDLIAEGDFDEYANSQIVEDPALIEQMNSRWFDKLWLQFSAPVVETKEQFKEFDMRVTDPESTKELVYSLAKEYYEKFPEYIEQ